MKIQFLILFFCFNMIALNAQTAKSVLDKASQAYINANSMTATFTLNTEDIRNKVLYSQDGTCSLKNNKFKIEVPDGITWFDGKNQWTYAKGSDEVNLSTPNGNELAAISPFILLNIYKKGFKLNLLSEKIESGRPVYSVEMIPESSKTDLAKIQLHINKANYMFSSIKITNKDGTTNHLLIKKIQTGLNLPDHIFTFDSKQYPNVEIIDLR